MYRYPVAEPDIGEEELRNIVLRPLGVAGLVARVNL